MLNWGNSPYNINSDLDAVTILRNFDKSVVMELSSQPGKFQKLQDKNTFLLPPAAPGVVLLELPAFQGSGLITFPSFPFFSHFSQTIFSLKKKSFPNCSNMFFEDTKVTRRARGREK